MIFTHYTTLITWIQTLIIGAGGLATAILAMWGLWTKILKPWFKELREKRETLFKAIGHIEDISEKLEKVSKELQPNGGGSIKDQVKQIANDVRIIRVERDATFHLSKEPMFKTDEKGYYVSCNSAFCSLMGVPEQEILGLGWLNFIVTEDKERVWEEWENIMESGKEISTYYTIKNPETAELTLIKCRAVVNRNGDKVVSIIGTIEKTAMKKTLHKLKTV